MNAAAARLACCLAALVLVLPAHAAAATSAEVAELAARAETDPAALAELLSVAEVDGRPVDFGAALAGASEAERAQRLAQLERTARAEASASNPADGAAEAAAARRRASEILGGVRAQPGTEPDEEGGDGGFSVPTLGLPAPLLVVLAAAVIAASIVLGRRLADRRVLEAETTAGGDPQRPPTPAQLEAQASRAESAGEFATAVRLRFEAGIERLGELERLRLAPPLTAARTARALSSPAFWSLASEYERIAFGGRRAGPDDAARAREGWRQVLSEAGAR